MNKSIISLFALAALLQVSLGASTSTVCPKVICGKLSDECFKYDSSTNEITLQTCASGKICDVPLTDIGAKDPGVDSATCTDVNTNKGGSGTPATPNALAGEKCSKADDCYSSKCTGGTCEGIQKGDACNGYSVSLTSAEKGKLCGKGLYCNTSTNVCDSGIAEGKTCSSTVSCLGRAMCTGSKCQGIASIKKGDDCSASFQCEAGLYCDTTCKDAPTNNYGTKCTKESDCTGGATCACSSTWANTAGEGICIAATGNADVFNSQRSAYKDDSFSGPLYMKVAGLAGHPTPKAIGDIGSLPTGDCYKKFAGGALYKEMDHGSSSSMVALSGFIVALFFALF